jgi:hypothetical protein
MAAQRRMKHRHGDTVSWYRGQLALHGLQGFFLTAQGLQGLQAAFFTAHGLHGLHAAPTRLVAQGLHGLHAFWAAQGLHAAIRSGCPWAIVFDSAHGFAALSAITIPGAVTATIPPSTAAESGLRFA